MILTPPMPGGFLMRKLLPIGLTTFFYPPNLNTTCATCLPSPSSSHPTLRPSPFNSPSNPPHQSKQNNTTLLTSIKQTTNNTPPPSLKKYPAFHPSSSQPGHSPDHVPFLLPPAHPQNLTTQEYISNRLARKASTSKTVV
ncbi:hypothetical protein NA56DRAFT_743892 [Hyaloscypha hepaticicola]|uniref:Uncharacterized protein n=1 Tax=Hyaloscypha hepaticicola TaxID=2082293 RepID=A0A2J6QJW4_9HELO|nr:hypothetical protein NA56DRAFT_743892 [Hyaloscypha hepaticicola]